VEVAGTSPGFLVAEFEEMDVLVSAPMKREANESQARCSENKSKLGKRQYNS